MGAACAIQGPADSWNAEQLGDYVAALGAAYEPYRERIIHHGVQGDILVGLNDKELKEILITLEITNMIHQKVLSGHLKKLSSLAAPTAAAAVGSSVPQTPSSVESESCQYVPLPDSFEVGDKITKTPRAIMMSLFQIPGIAVDPTDLDPAVEKIAKAVGGGFGDGISKYDCFINYRVASDADLAEKLYLYLKTQGIHAFLDKKCLKNGEKWKDGFLTGLKNSKCFVALISRKGLERVRDVSENHTWDNVLLEYETALNIRDVTSNSKYICPLHVGQCEKGILSKFTDFNASLYPDSIESMTGKKTGAVKKAQGGGDNGDGNELPPPAPETGDEGGCDVKCAKCFVAVVENCMGTDKVGVPWSCDFLGHEGANQFRTPDRYYGCPNIVSNTCDWVICPTCYEHVIHSNSLDHLEDKMSAIQPRGTCSRHFHGYYCDVEKIAVEHFNDAEAMIVIVTFNVRGDGSRGAIQDPLYSQLVINGKKYSPSLDITYFIKDYYQKKGELKYNIDRDGRDDFFAHRVAFVYGSSGYSEAVLTIPHANLHHSGGKTKANLHFPKCDAGHILVISNYADYGYESGFVCNDCSNGGTGFRWFCEECSHDKCFSCVPCPLMHPVCNYDHALEQWKKKKPPGYQTAVCDECGREDLQYDREFYHCPPCSYDLCIGCASQQMVNKMNEDEEDREEDEEEERYNYGDDDDDDDD